MKILASCLCLLAISPVNADEKAGRIPVSIFCINYADGLKSVFVKSGNEGFRTVGLSTANVIDAGEVMTVDGKISIHGPEGGENPHAVVATAEVAGIREPLLVLTPVKGDGEGGSAYQTTVVESAESGFSMGGFNFINLSPHAVKVKMDDEVFEVASGAKHLFKPAGKAGGIIPVTIDYQNGDAWQLMSSARWAARADRRTLVCIQLDARTRRMVVKSIPLRGKLE
jgi:hypothetical protein